VRPKLRVWVVFGSELKFGDGRARLLELIDERGSLRRAAAGLDMSYRNAWGYLRELEKAAGFKFVERAPGGRPRSGMCLTAPAREFLACYRKFQGGLDRAAVRHFSRSFANKVFRPTPARRAVPATRARSVRASSAAR
jgi:molybdate transport system regulatory protein